MVRSHPYVEGIDKNRPYIIVLIVLAGLSGQCSCPFWVYDHNVEIFIYNERPQLLQSINLRELTMIYAPLPYTVNVLEGRSEALELIEMAHGAERAGRYKDAYDLHRQGATLLSQTIRSGKKKSVERRLDKLCLRASKERMKVLRNAAEGRGPPFVSPLPSSVTARLEMADLQPGKIMLSLVGCLF